MGGEVERELQLPPRKRLRVQFEGLGGGRLLISLPPGLRLVADLARTLRDRLQAAPVQELCLSIDGFTLPLAQQLLGVVRDDDVLTVREGGGGASCAANGFCGGQGADGVRAVPLADSEVSLAASPPARKRRRSSGSDGLASMAASPLGMCSPGSLQRALGEAIGGEACEHSPLVSSAEASRAAREALSVANAPSAPKRSKLDELAARKAAALAEVDAALSEAQASRERYQVASPEVVAPAAVAPAAAVTEAKGKAENAGEAAATDEGHKAFLGGLAWSVDEAILERDFSDCGKILSLKLLTDRETGLSRGMAFITFADAAGLEAALKFNGDDYAGRTLTVAKATADVKGGGKGKAEGKGKNGKNGKGGKGKGKAGGGGKGHGKLGEKPAGCTSVVVKGLAYEAAEDDLRGVFCGCGAGPTNIRILTNRETGESLGIAFVDFDDEGAVDEAVKLSETQVRNKAIFVDFAKPRK